MTHPPATLGQIIETFEPLAEGAGVVFRTAEGDIGGGYHVTELKLAHFDSIDCGAHRHRWSEAHVQLLDAPGSGHMPAGKFAGILRKSVDAIGDLRDLPVFVEFALENRGLQRFRIGDIDGGPNRITVSLEAENAACKPAAASRETHNGAGCCGSRAEAAACSC